MRQVGCYLSLFGVLFGIQFSISAHPSTPPLPKFVATKNAPCNMRVGPGKQFPVDWVYNYPGTPFKVLAEFQGWYKVKDITGTTGWIIKPLLTKRPTKMVLKETQLLKTDTPNSRIQAVLKPHVIVSIKSCSKKACKATLKHESLKLSGYLNPQHLWPL